MRRALPLSRAGGSRGRPGSQPLNRVIRSCRRTWTFAGCSPPARPVASALGRSRAPGGRHPTTRAPRPPAMRWGERRIQRSTTPRAAPSLRGGTRPPPHRGGFPTTRFQPRPLATAASTRARRHPMANRGEPFPLGCPGTQGQAAVCRPWATPTGTSGSRGWEATPPGCLAQPARVPPPRSHPPASSKGVHPCNARRTRGRWPWTRDPRLMLGEARTACPSRRLQAASALGKWRSIRGLLGGAPCPLPKGGVSPHTCQTPTAPNLSSLRGPLGSYLRWGWKPRQRQPC